MRGSKRQKYSGRRDLSSETLHDRICEKKVLVYMGAWEMTSWHGSGRGLCKETWIFRVSSAREFQRIQQSHIHT